MIGVVGLVVVAAIAAGPQSEPTDLDFLMRDVLDRRNANAEALTAFRFREIEEMTIRGQEGVAPVQSYRKELRWSERDGLMVRETVSINGVFSSEPLREFDPTDETSIRDFSTDSFYSWDTFLTFPFERGRYLLRGAEVLDGREVLRVDYFPRYLVSRRGEEGDIANDFDRSTVVSLWILEEERQILRWEFDTVGLDFLPARWLVRVGEVRVTMDLDTAADGAWLPRRISLAANASMAPSLLKIRLTRDFDDFERVDGTPVLAEAPPNGDAMSPSGDGSLPIGAGISVAPGTVVSEIVFHGNFRIPDDQLVEAAGVELGTVFTDELPGEVRRRLLASRLVDRADVNVSSRTLTDDGEVSLAVVVRERRGFSDRFLFLPSFEWSDEYGITIGARVSMVGLYGTDERLSFPLAVGGRDRVEAEFVDDFDDAFLTGVRAAGGYRSEVNPHFDELVKRFGARGRVLKRFRRFQVDVEAAWDNVEFFEDIQDQVTGEAAVRFDTRRETGLPRNATYMSAAWRPLKVIDGTYINRYNVDLRGYVGGPGRSTFVVGATADIADDELPDYEKYLLGGLTTLRGFSPGEFIGDKRIIASAEARMPVWEPFPVVLIGLNAFWDTGSVWDDGDELSGAKFYNGVGGGAFLMAAFLQLNVDVAYGLDNGWQWHIGSGLRY